MFGSVDVAVAVAATAGAGEVDWYGVFWASGADGGDCGDGLGLENMESKPGGRRTGTGTLDCGSAGTGVEEIGTEGCTCTGVWL